MAMERDIYGDLTDLSEACQEVMLGMFDLLDDMGLAGFPPELIERYNEVRRLFVHNFKTRYPGRGEGRAIWL